MSNFDSASHDEFYQSLLGDFLGESEQLLVNLNENLLRLDAWTRSREDARDPSRAKNLLNEMFRSAHSLKGLSNMLGLDEIELLVGYIERLFDAGRKGALEIGNELVSLMFEAIDRLAMLVDSLKDPDAPAVLCDPVIERISRVLGKIEPNAKSERPSRVERTLGKIESRVADVLASMGVPERRGPRDVPTDSAAEEEARRPDTKDEESLFARNGDGSSVTDFGSVIDDADISSRFMPIFIDETELALDQVTETLLGLESGHDPDKLKQLLVVSHRIKGSAASVGLNRAAKLSHLVEDLIQGLLETGGSLSSDMVDVLLKCCDELRRYIEGLKEGAIPIDRFEELAADLVGVRPAAPPVTPFRETESKTISDPSPRANPTDDAQAEANSSPSTVVSDSETASGPTLASATDLPALLPVNDQLRTLVRASAPLGLPLFAGVATFQANLPLAGLKAELLYEKLAGLGEVCYFDPAPERFDAVDKLDCVRFGIATELAKSEVCHALRTAGVLGSVLESLDPGDEAAPSAANASQAGNPELDSAFTREDSSISNATTPAPMPASPDKASGNANTGETADSADRRQEASCRPAETLRVDVDRLDQLMNLAGQLVVSKARFAQIIDHLRVVFGGKRSVFSLSGLLASLGRVSKLDAGGDLRLIEAELSSLCAEAKAIQNELEPVRHEVESFRQMHASINELEEAVHQLGRVADDIQKNVMDTRMVPIGPLFMRFHRVVRDITRTSGKSIRLVIRGEKTELDKRMIDELGDPLIHLIRNAADHGIESPEARVRAGKPADGTIVLDACHRGNNIFVQLRDDGKGLDTDAILRRAIEKDMILPADAERMPIHQIQQLVWQPGFSTAEKVTDTSGRGVGMDIVKSRVESLNGTVELDSKFGEGTLVTIKLPLTLAILPSLMVDVDGDVFAVPMESVAEIVRVRGKDLATVHGKLAATVRGRVVSIIRLEEVFEWNSGLTDRESLPSGDLTLVIVNERGEEIGLVVDRVIGEDDIVIKSMSENYQNVPGIAGASVLGDGRVSLILDTAAVVSLAAQTKAGAVSTANETFQGRLY